MDMLFINPNFGLVLMFPLYANCIINLFDSLYPTDVPTNALNVGSYSSPTHLSAPKKVTEFFPASKYGFE